MASSATIRAIESSTIHQIQSGQVIVDLCSVAKELVENSLDAGATTIDVRFKNQGLDSIEIQDNGSGIAPHNYESIALKHYTSKLASYDDLSELQTFGFRGEALSSLCALSRFSVVTCAEQQQPRASRLEFETSGKLKSTSVVSGQRGTTVIVENLFHNLPVRRRELERNIKREWGKVINLLNQYACVQTGVKFTVSQQPTKGKRMVLFSTKGNPTTRENIINVFGVKTMSALITMDLSLELVPSAGPLNKGRARADGSTAEVRVVGHVSRPAHGEGRQTPDRQMFYVNGRPCGLPQFAKVFNEVYRSYNASQSPFIFADIRLDTHLYDVNVSPDKRTILLHDQGQMLDNLRESLIELFETQDVTIPVAQAHAPKQTPFKTAATPAPARTASSRHSAAGSQQEPGPSSPTRATDEDDEMGDARSDGDGDGESESEMGASDESQPRKHVSDQPASSRKSISSLSRWLANGADARERLVMQPAESESNEAPPTGPVIAGEELPGESAGAEERPSLDNHNADATGDENPAARAGPRVTTLEENPESLPEDTEAEDKVGGEPEPSVPSIAPPSQPPSSRAIPLGTARPFKRPTQEVATIIIGDHTVTSLIGNSSKRLRVDDAPGAGQPVVASTGIKRSAPLPSFGGKLSQLFSASAGSGSGLADRTETADEEVEDMEVSDHDEPEHGEVGEEVEEEEDEDGEDSLFVSQKANSVAGSEDYDDDEGLADTRTSPSRTDDVKVPGSPGARESLADSPPHDCDAADDDADYADEADKKAQEDQTVQAMIDAAEATAEPTEEGEKRSQMFVKGRSKRKEMTLNLSQRVKTSPDAIQQSMAALTTHAPQTRRGVSSDGSPNGLDAADAEEKLSLKISKSDFAKMRIIGQFNLGFILAVRDATSSPDEDAPQADDELFIIDQHASDEKYNFERLQATTTVQSQRLVQPKTLDLTALEEEIILEHLPALERNGFLAQVDTSGARPVGSRVQLLSLPLSRETTFSLADLEELIFLLADNPTSSASTVPRPSKVRKMFAMRACRSSIMIGRALSARQMERVVRHMGEMEKPWNCPHGRPTMRHLCGLGAWDGRGWREDNRLEGGRRTDWAAWAREKREEE